MTTLAFPRGWSKSTAANPFLFSALVAWRRVRRQLRIRSDRVRLQALPDYLLADIGISRSQIDQATAFGRPDRAEVSHAGLTDRR